MYKQEEEEEETQPLDLWIYCIIAIITGNPPHVCGDGVDPLMWTIGELWVMFRSKDELFDVEVHPVVSVYSD